MTTPEGSKVEIAELSKKNKTEAGKSNLAYVKYLVNVKSEWGKRKRNSSEDETCLVSRLKVEKMAQKNNI